MKKEMRGRIVMLAALACFTTQVLSGQLDSTSLDSLSDISDLRDLPEEKEEEDFGYIRKRMAVRSLAEERFLRGLRQEAEEHLLRQRQREQANDLKGGGGTEYYDEEAQEELEDEIRRRGRDSELITESDCPEECSHYKPVCGSDRNVYDSECHLKKENCGESNVSVVEWEECRGRHHLCPGSCLEIYDPVCSLEGNLYPNMCVMRRRNCGKPLETQALKFCFTRHRESKSYDPCPNECLEVYRPVCASNGIIYYNECFMRMRTCGEDVQVVNLLSCAQKPKCPEFCLPLYDPVCGSDGKLYINYCRMLQDNCGVAISRMPSNFCVKSDEVRREKEKKREN